MQIAYLIIKGVLQEKSSVRCSTKEHMSFKIFNSKHSIKVSTLGATFRQKLFLLIGNDRIHELTKTNQKLNIYLKAANGTYRNGYWTQFYIADESDKYRLTV